MTTYSGQHKAGPRPIARREAAEVAEFHPIVPAACPACGGNLKDYNAETVVSAPAGSVVHSPGLLSHLFVCQGCGKKILAPPREAGR